MEDGEAGAGPMILRQWESRSVPSGDSPAASRIAEAVARAREIAVIGLYVDVHVPAAYVFQCSKRFIFARDGIA